MAKGRRTKTLRQSATDSFLPGPTAEEKRARRRKSSAAYYARNPQLRERSRLAMQARRAAVKARRREWDPPTPAQVAEARRAALATPSFHSDRVSDAVLNGSIHFQDMRGITESSEAGSSFLFCRRPDAGPPPDSAAPTIPHPQPLEVPVEEVQRWRPSYG
ncbi:hypothetical protein DFH06DRAFT_1342958 [Mycena polygramma]|nr:hypothetical protein DFH06DRAFT_1342958 [Mycena polygramma]